jgi:hypothetical protein
VINSIRRAAPSEGALASLCDTHKGEV